MSGGLGAPTVTKVIGCIIYLQIMSAYARTKDITLTEPNSIIKAEIGDKLLITCLGTKCQNPVFTWASLSDNPLSGAVVNDGQISVLTMKISSENLDMYGSYRCTVHCDNPPAEKSFKVIAYSFPKPILTISSLIAGEQSRINCTIPNAYPFHMVDARILIDETTVAEYKISDEDSEAHVLHNISLSHNLMLTDKNEAQEVKCEAELRFQEEGIYPIFWDAFIQLNLLYPPGKPTITVLPGTNVNKAENISLTCTFESRSPASVQWVKVDEDNELVMSIDDQGTLTIPNARPEDSGMYICRVQNNVGKTSSQVQITVQALPEKPKLTIFPTTKVQIGQFVTIECLANEMNVHVTLWKVLKDEDTAILETNGKLVIKEADPIDTAIYKCTAENVYGVSEASESLTVEYPPIEIAFTSSDEEVNEGGEVTLTCASKGFPEPSFLLYHLLPSGDRDLLSEGPVVTLTNVTSGVYQCEATNSLGSKKEKLELRVKFPPKNTHITITPSAEVKEGDSIGIKCVSEASPAPRLALKLKTEDGVRELVSEGGQYQIAHVDMTHSGMYICESINVAGQQQVETMLSIQVPPKNTNITIAPSTEVREGDFIDIVCVSEAFPAPRLSLKVRTEGVRELVSEGGRYQIAHASMKHSGTYICESTNIAGQQQVETTLTIQVPPKKTVLTISPSPVLKEGESGHIRCISEAFPAPRLVLKKQTEAGQIELEVESGEYSFTHVAMEHAGTYICESTNVAGKQIAETTMTVQAPPKNTFISITPSSVVKEGDDVKIQCISEAYPSPLLVLMVKSEHGLISQLESEDGWYNITKAEEKNTGTYICESKNVVGQQTTEAVLTVQKRQQSPRFDYVPPAIIGSVVLVTAGFIGLIAYHLKQAKVQGSYSLVKALRNKV
ncbi:vascular cell adhesion protein 1 isoform X2 [Lithobates pipiens]